MTAADFVYSWRREVDPRTGAQYAEGLAPIENALDIATGNKPPDTLGVEALDARTLSVHLKGPTPYLLDLLAQHIFIRSMNRRSDSTAITGYDPNTWSATAPSCCART